MCNKILSDSGTHRLWQTQRMSVITTKLRDTLLNNAKIKNDYSQNHLYLHSGSYEHSKNWPESDKNINKSGLFGKSYNSVNF